MISTQHVAGYVKFTTAAGSVSISGTHMLVVNGAMADPRSAKVGDQLQTPSGPAAITAIEDVKEPGAFATGASWGVCVRVCSASSLWFIPIPQS